MTQNSKDPILVRGEAIRKLVEKTSEQIKALIGSNSKLSPEDTVQMLIIFSCHLIGNMDKGFTTVILENEYLAQHKILRNQLKKTFDEFSFVMMERQFDKSPAK